MVASGQSDLQVQDDDSYMERQDVFAEAVKLTLLGIKDAVATEMDADIVSKVSLKHLIPKSKAYLKFIALFIALDKML